jgi:hypothetical protein
MAAQEYWVMKVIATKAEVERFERAEAAGPWVLALLRGEVFHVNGEIVEPIEVYDNDQESAITRSMAEHARTGRTHKVVLNAEL